ncbi:AAA family ATPase [Caldivirga sp. UBA161]|uniref:AAA family ATPase n=1 Tax=Caldivirga sp. UBA161 TaxID=1915569 RepID=UPI0025C06A7D|nr:ATP-binding protein [Caldivirga sp. UBA161]
MLFSLYPKESRGELFGRDEELDYIKRQVHAGNWIIVTGQRMIGKTSIVKVALNELSSEGFRAMYINLQGVNSLKTLLHLMINEANKSMLFKDIDASVNLTIGPLGITVKRGARPMTTLLEYLLSIKRDTVIALDEVQELAAASPQLLKIMGNVHSSNPRIHFILTGSYVGLVKALLEPSSTSPLYGRPPVEVKLRPFTQDQSKAFLMRGFSELGVNFNEYERVISELDGITGWLTLFGNLHGVRGLSIDDALNRVIEDGAKIMVSELNNFLKGRVNRRLYLAVLEALRHVDRWIDIKAYVSYLIRQEVDDRVLANALTALIKYNLIEKYGEGRYRLIDPILKGIRFMDLA